MAKQSQRLMSLDVMRGITIAGMILVNNPGSWGSIYAPLRHAQWHGLTPTDLVFPFFMFIMGVSMYFSLRKYEFTMSGSAFWKVLRRTLVLLLVGWGIGWLARFWNGMMNPDKSVWESINNFGSMRVMGVFTRLALCYFATSVLALLCSSRTMKWLVGIMLAGYAVILLVAHGLEFSADNIIAVIDRAVVGTDHMYTDTVDDVSLVFDPEGLLSTLPSVAHCMIGFLCGEMIVKVKDNTMRSYNLLLIGAVLALSGWLLSYGVPLNKKIWSSTFVLTTCGLASMLLGLLVWVLDIKRRDGAWSTFFRVFGINPLSLYVLSTLLAMTLNRVKITVGAAEQVTMSLQSFIYKNLLVPLCFDDRTLASLIFALLFVLVNWCIGYILYKKQIIIKI